MEAAATEPYLKPIPEITDANRPFFEALRKHVFVVPRCVDCGHYHWVPYPACRSCLSENLSWTPVSGDATMYSFTVVHRGPGAYADEVPYVVAMGELVEQPRPCLVIANLYGTAPEDLRIGQPLQIGYEDVASEDTTVYYWVTRPT